MLCEHRSMEHPPRAKGIKMKKILIVDDDKNIIKALRFGLGKYYEIVFAHTISKL